MEEEGFNLMIKKLRCGTRSYQLLEHFSTYGAVLKTSVYHKSRGFVKFQSYTDARKALEEVTSVNGKRVEICWSQSFIDVEDVAAPRKKHRKRTARILNARKLDVHCANAPAKVETQCCMDVGDTSCLSRDAANTSQHQAEHCQDDGQLLVLQSKAKLLADTPRNEHEKEVSGQGECRVASECSSNHSESVALPDEIVDYGESEILYEDNQLCCAEVMAESALPPFRDNNDFLLNGTGRRTNTIGLKKGPWWTKQNFEGSPQQPIKKLDRLFGFIGLKYKEGEYAFVIDKPEVTFGRNPDCNIRLGGKETSKYHCLLVVGAKKSGCQAHLKHTGSNTSSTRFYINGEYGQKLPVGQWVELHDHTEFGIGEFHFQWRAGNRADPAFNLESSRLLRLNNNEELGRSGASQRAIKTSTIKPCKLEPSKVVEVLCIHVGTDKYRDGGFGEAEALHGQSTCTRSVQEVYTSESRKHEGDTDVKKNLNEPMMNTHKSSNSAGEGGKIQELEILQLPNQTVEKSLPNELRCASSKSKSTSKLLLEECTSELGARSISQGNESSFDWTIHTGSEFEEVDEGDDDIPPPCSSQGNPLCSKSVKQQEHPYSMRGAEPESDGRQMVNEIGESRGECEQEKTQCAMAVGPEHRGSVRQKRRENLFIASAGNMSGRSGDEKVGERPVMEALGATSTADQKTLQTSSILIVGEMVPNYYLAPCTLKHDFLIQTNKKPHDRPESVSEAGGSGSRKMSKKKCKPTTTMSASERNMQRTLVKCFGREILSRHYNRGLDGRRVETTVAATGFELQEDAVVESNASRVDHRPSSGKAAKGSLHMRCLSSNPEKLEVLPNEASENKPSIDTCGLIANKGQHIHCARSNALVCVGGTPSSVEIGYRCEPCKLNCPTIRKLNIHKKTESHLYVASHASEDWDLTCKVCQMRLLSVPALVRHKQSKHHLRKLGELVDKSGGRNGGKKVRCQACNTCYSDHSKLKRHRRTLSHQSRSISLGRADNESHEESSSDDGNA